jgi:uncharacterized membrane protein YdbT with pleckstrin-like domain
MGYVEKHLISGEKILYKTRLHSIAVLFPICMAILFGVAGGFCLYQSAEDQRSGTGDAKMFAIAGALLFIAAAVAVVVALVKRNSTEMAVTNRRVFIKSGLMSRRTIEMLVWQIESIAITEPVLGRMLGYGSVVIRGTGGTPETFHLIANPTEFRTQVQQQIEARHADMRPGTPLATN